jgi:hypothetical protein
MKMTRSNLRTVAVLGAGIYAGAILSAAWSSFEKPAHAQAAKPPVDLPTLAAEVATMKGKLTDQSHVMQDVSYHFSNLWFAGQYQNWDLANFYASETKSHLRWAVRVIPVRKDNAGREVVLQPILEGLENGPLKELQDAIAKHDKPLFEVTYRRTMEACYGCHKAADKPFLRPQIPSEPESPIINFDPTATGAL